MVREGSTILEHGARIGVQVLNILAISHIYSIFSHIVEYLNLPWMQAIWVEPRKLGLSFSGCARVNVLDYLFICGCFRCAVRYGKNSNKWYQRDVGPNNLYESLVLVTQHWLTHKQNRNKRNLTILAYLLFCSQ